MDTLQQRIQQHIENSSQNVFSRNAFATLGGYDQVGRALRALCKNGTLERIDTGLYTKVGADENLVSRETSALLKSALRNPGRSRRLHALNKSTEPAPAANNTSILRPTKAPRGRLTATQTKASVGNDSLSQRLGMQFPYDWSNPNMDLDTFTLRVLERGCFLDMLKLAAHIGIDTFGKSFQAHRSKLPPRSQQKVGNIMQGAQAQHG